MKKLWVFTLYSDKGASSQYRAYIYKNVLENNFDVNWSFFWNNKYATKYMYNKKKYFLLIGLQYLIASIKRIFELYFMASKYDIVFIQKACIPKLKFTFLKRIKRKGVKIFFDIDDAVYLSSNDNSEDIAKMSHIVICGNESLNKHFESLGCRCVLFPTVDNTIRYKPYWKDTYKNKIIGWIGSASTINNLDEIVESINLFMTRHPDASFVIISNDDCGYVKKIRNSKLIIWEKEKYLEYLSDLTIGIMPLKDTDYNRGKCGFKLIQYLNMRKPVIGSDVGVNKSIIDGNGFVVKNNTEWLDAFERLLYDKKCYYKYINHIDDYFLDKYHFSKMSDKLVEILDN